MKLSYSEYRTYLNCPRLYDNEQRKVEPCEKASAYFKLYGLLIEQFFRKYTNEIVRKNISISNDEIKSVLTMQWNKILRDNYVDWHDPWVKLTSEQIFNTVYEDVLKNIKAFDFWKEMQAEVSLDILLKNGDHITGRIDFIRQNKDTVEILDGKGTDKIETNVDVEQLYFYALLYLLRHKKLPDKIGFLFYRYQLVKYVDLSKDIIIGFKDKLSVVKNAVKNDKVFDPKVALSKHCRWCVYKYNCNAFVTKKNANAEKRAARKTDIVATDNLVEIL